MQTECYYNEYAIPRWNGDIDTVDVHQLMSIPGHPAMACIW